MLFCLRARLTSLFGQLADHIRLLLGQTHHIVFIDLHREVVFAQVKGVSTVSGAVFNGRRRI